MKFQLPDLPFAMDALEPHMSAETLKLHHGKHHKAYVDKLNKAIEGTPYADLPLEEIVRAVGNSRGRRQETNADSKVARPRVHRPRKANATRTARRLPLARQICTFIRRRSRVDAEGNALPLVLRSRFEPVAVKLRRCSLPKPARVAEQDRERIRSNRLLDNRSAFVIDSRLRSGQPCNRHPEG